MSDISTRLRRSHARWGTQDVKTTAIALANEATLLSGVHSEERRDLFLDRQIAFRYGAALHANSVRSRNTFLIVRLQ